MSRIVSGDRGVVDWSAGLRLACPADIPESWTADVARRATARILTSLRLKRSGACAHPHAPGPRGDLDATAVGTDAEYGDKSALRQSLHRPKLRYAPGISPTLTAFLGTRTLRIDRGNRSRAIRAGWPEHEPVSVRVLAGLLPATPWPRVSWQNGSNSHVGRRFRGFPRHARPAPSGSGDSRPKFGPRASAAPARVQHNRPNFSLQLGRMLLSLDSKGKEPGSCQETRQN